MTERGATATNYQLMPGDRVFVKAYPLVAPRHRLARILAPIERIFGITLLGAGTVRSIQNQAIFGNQRRVRRLPVTGPARRDPAAAVRETRACVDTDPGRRQAVSDGEDATMTRWLVC